MLTPARSLMLFAAGFGTRMRPLTDTQPKPMIRVAGRPLIDHALELAQRVSPGVIVANLHYMPQPLIQHLRPLGVRTVVEHPEILDTGGGLRNALPLLGNGSVFTLNTDAVWAGPNPLEMLEATWDPATMDALLICVPIAQVSGRSDTGDFSMDSDGRLERGPGFVYGGAQILKTDLVASMTETVFSLNRIWDQMKAAGRLYGLNYPGLWCDVGHPGGIALAEEMLRTAHV